MSTRIFVAYERGEKEPSPQSLDSIAHILRFPIEFFSGHDLDEPPLDGSSFRALTTLTARQRDQALASGALALALSDWIDSRFELPEPRVPRYEGIDPETASHAIRDKWELGERPISNAIHLLESRGVRIYSLADDCREIDAFSFWRGGIPYIFLNTMKSAEHSRMDAAHELGHLVLHWKGGARGRDAEHEAQLFGSAFLMPRGSMLADAPRSDNVERLISAKALWKVSVSALAYRMHRLDLITDWQYRWLFIQISRDGYRTNEPKGCQSETSQVLAKVLRALREDGMTMAGVADALCIFPEELNKLVFGLVLTEIMGSHPDSDRRIARFC